MFNTTNKMCLAESEVFTPTNGDFEDLVRDGFTLPSDILIKRTSRKKSTDRPPPSPRSPYLSSLNMNSKTAAMASWRLPRPSLGDTRGETLKDHCSTCHMSLSNGHGGGDHKDKEDMYDEIIRLKKSLQAQKSENQHMKVKLRRLEEDAAKREKQIKELLDPIKGSEYTRSFVDKKMEGSVIVNGLKQRILKLEQQCRDKENALSKLQSELRTTNLEELKITVETYFKEIQRLKILLDGAENSSRAESKCSVRQQKALSLTVHRLTENVKHLQQENAALREELDTDNPAAGIKGYREWSRQRLLRRLLAVEKSLEDTRRHTHSAKSCAGLNEEAEAACTEAPEFPIATESVISKGTVTEEETEFSALRQHFRQLEEERLELQERLMKKNEEVMELRKQRDDILKETEVLNAKHKELEKVEQKNRQECEQLLMRIQTLVGDRSKLGQTKVCAPSHTMTDHLKHAQNGAGQEDDAEKAAGCQENRGEGQEALMMDAKKENAALIIQMKWRHNRKKDIVMLQAVIRGYLFRDTWLKNNLKNSEKKSKVSLNAGISVGELDVAELKLIQSAFRGHLTRSRATKSPASVATNNLAALAQRRANSTNAPSGEGYAYPNKNVKTDLDPVSRKPQTKDHGELCSTAEFDADSAVESDDSDDIVVSPSRPLRSRILKL